MCRPTNRAQESYPPPGAWLTMSVTVLPAQLDASEGSAVATGAADEGPQKLPPAKLPDWPRGLPPAQPVPPRASRTVSPRMSARSWGSPAPRGSTQP